MPTRVRWVDVRLACQATGRARRNPYFFSLCRSLRLCLCLASLYRVNSLLVKRSLLLLCFWLTSCQLSETSAQFGDGETDEYGIHWDFIRAGDEESFQDEKLFFAQETEEKEKIRAPAGWSNTIWLVRDLTAKVQVILEAGLDNANEEDKKKVGEWMGKISQDTYNDLRFQAGQWAGRLSDEERAKLSEYLDPTPEEKKTIESVSDEDKRKILEGNLQRQRNVAIYCMQPIAWEHAGAMALEGVKELETMDGDRALVASFYILARLRIMSKRLSQLEKAGAKTTVTPEAIDSLFSKADAYRVKALKKLGITTY